MNAEPAGPFRVDGRRIGSVSAIWFFNGQKWSAVTSGITPALWQHSYIFNHLIEYERRLYVATGGPVGSSSVWELTDGRYWRQVAGRGLYGSWGADGPIAQDPLGAAEWVYRMAVIDNDLVVGLAGYAGAAQVWRYSKKVRRHSSRP